MIDYFSGQYKFLSNFYPAPLTYAGDDYPSSEHAYQAMKSDDPAYRERVRRARTAGEAKRLGEDAVLRRGWDTTKLDMMLRIVRRKFENPELRRMLLATGDEELVEGNNWGDTFWGMCNGVGDNHLGKILMKVRAEARKEG